MKNGLQSDWKVGSADELTLTEDKVLRRNLDPIRLSIAPHETFTLGLTLFP